MSGINQLYEHLAAEPSPTCDRLLGAALRNAEPEYFQRICDILLQRGEDASWAALVSAFPKLPEALRADLGLDPERMRKAIAETMRRNDHVARLNALRALEAHPFPQLAVFVSDALRDQRVDVCESAARLLLRMASDYLDHHGAVPPPPGADLAPTAVFARQQMARALHEALHAFEMHWRLEPVRAALWMARDIGDGLWTVLNKHRARVRDVITDRLGEWDDPRLVGFLICALGQPEWATHAEPLVAKWTDRGHIVELLAHTNLLDVPEIAERVGSVRQPSWFRKADEFLMDLPPELRAAAPRWVDAAGYSDAERCGMLSRWMHRSCPALRRACVYALVRFDTPDVIRRLEEVATGTDGVAAFARWWIAGQGRGVEAVSGVKRETGAATSDPHAAEPAEFTLFWQTCRRAGPRGCQPLLRLLRGNLDLWRDPVVGRLSSSDARDRLLALQVLATRELAPRYKSELQTLLHDGEGAIRGLAKTLLQSLARREMDGETFTETSVAAPAARSKHRGKRSVEEIRVSLLRLLMDVLAKEVSQTLTEAAIERLTGVVNEFRQATGHAPLSPSGAAEEPS